MRSTVTMLNNCKKWITQLHPAVLSTKARTAGVPVRPTLYNTVATPNAQPRQHDLCEGGPHNYAEDGVVHAKQDHADDNVTLTARNGFVDQRLTHRSNANTNTNAHTPKQTNKNRNEQKNEWTNTQTHERKNERTDEHHTQRHSHTDTQPHSHKLPYTRYTRPQRLDRKNSRSELHQRRVEPSIFLI